MTKAQLIDVVAKKAHMPKSAAKEAVNCVFDEVIRSLEKGDKVVVSGFGTFYVNKVDDKLVVPFGKEDMSKINKNDLLQVFRSGFNSALQLTEMTHFNPKYPEFHNVYISSMKNKYAMTYDGNDWSLVMKDELIDQIYDKKRDYIEENMEEFLESLTKSQIDALYRWLAVDDDHDYVQKVKNNIKLML